MSTKLTTRQRDKLIEAAQNAVEFTVEGRGEFPFDMLRYDRCWPANEGQSHLIQPAPLEARYDRQRRIALRGLIGPTAARWASFGWRVLEDFELRREGA